MKKIFVFLLALIMAALFTSNICAANLKTAMIPDDTDWIIHFDVEKFSTTELSKFLLGEGMGMFHKTRKTVLEKFKVKLLKDIKGITIFGSGKDEDNAVVSIAGDFNKEFLLTMLGFEETHKEVKYGDFILHQWDHDHCATFATDKLIIAGEKEEAVKRVLDVYKGKGKNIASSKMMEYLKNIPADAFLRAVAKDISSISEDDSPVILKKVGMAFFMALEKNDNLKLKLSLNTDSVETAKNIEQIVNGFIALAELGVHNKEEIKLRLLESVKMSIKGSTLQIELIYPTEELVKILAHERGFGF
jgi:hypothetical protein